ncbi:hypothetical protein KL933_004999 [Ogataea haglerorum]|uniref:Cystinosin n=1 Tax=Ogataea haglerorum TaxID=1937702 RepID=A0AAN6D180_9ASCO|nr:hypothetical protein KL933_004999 [Ogataea haglerorum]KAG7725424.1 hypothetical protein KL948_004985 [Ogataea haglerorum]
MLTLSHMSQLLGWLYFSCWSLSFYPTIVSNIRLKSVQGISIDFMFFNTAGFTLYSFYTGFLCCSARIQYEFYLRHGKYPLIKLNDFFFGIHGLLLNLLLISQAYIWGFKKNDNQIISNICKVVYAVLILFAVGYALIIHFTYGKRYWIDLLTSLGMAKIFMSVCKNIPQAVYNYNRKSTHGWPIQMVWLDFAGAVFSFSQLFLDAYVAGDVKSIFNNLPKFLLSMEVALADVVFFTQHYFLYYQRDSERYGLSKSFNSYSAILEEDQSFLREHQHDHDHKSFHNIHCTVSPIDKDELQRLIP